MNPLRGDVFYADLEPVRGHEQAGHRPVLVVSIDLYNAGPADLLMVCPITTARRRVRWHVSVTPPEGGLALPSTILCDGLRSVSKGRLGRRLGLVSQATMEAVDERLRILLGL